MRLFLLLNCLVALGVRVAGYHAVSQLPKPVQQAARAGTKPKGRPSLCGDLLQRYASKPAGLILLGCEAGQPGGQTIAVATYKVLGANAAQAETFFRARYGMGKLTFVCCGWEPAEGKRGQVDNATLRKLNPNYSLLITMYADDQALVQSDAGAWRDKRKVKQFLVKVTLIEV